MVFYRKYRPQKIGELDSGEVREKLYSALKSPSVAHAFLFTGPKGLGKTSTARIVAKVLNCKRLVGQRSASSSKEKKLNASGSTLDANIEPCNKCYQCISITNGTNIDVLEIDGASNRGIDEIRDLREKVKISPASSNKKVYIIDEVHMLTTEAFNALLKTLEEPPSHVVFILCTTEPHKVPATIVSRCFHIQFNKATAEELISSFKRIIKSEKLQADTEALSLIASMSDGSFRDGSKILEEIVLAGEGKLTKDLVEKKYQISNIKYQISQILEMLVDRDVKKALDHVSKLIDQGLDMGYFIQQLIQALHSHFLYKAGIKNSEFRIDNSELEIEDTKRLIELLSKAHGEIKYAVLPQLPLEMAIVEWSLTKMDSSRPLNYSSKPNGNTRLVNESIPASTAVVHSSHEYKGTVKSKFRGETHPSNLSNTKPPRATVSNNLLQDLINKVKVHDHSIAGVLRGCRVISYDKDKLIIEAGFKFHKERLDDPKTREVIKKVAKEINGKTVDLEIVLKE